MKLNQIQEYDPRVQEALRQVPEGHWKEFSRFAGPPLEAMVGWDKIVLVGDACHPVAEGLGSGAANALEDAWILARAIENCRSESNCVAESLKMFDAVRSPFFSRM